MKLFVTGPTANSMRSLNGGWSYSWQGHIADAYAKDHNTILEALQQRFGNDNIIYRPTVTFDEKAPGKASCAAPTQSLPKPQYAQSRPTRSSSASAKTPTARLPATSPTSISRPCSATW